MPKTKRKTKRKKLPSYISKRSYRKPWTKAEIRQLNEWYPANSNASIARELGRTMPAVGRMALILGLEKEPGYLIEMGQKNVAKRWK